MKTRARFPVRPGDLRGLSRLGTDAVVGVTDLVEAMHHTISSGTRVLGDAPQGKTKGITGFVYRSVRGVSQAVGQGMDLLLRALPEAGPGVSPEREAGLAVINGLWGDHLEKTGNPLAIPMSFRIAGMPWRESLHEAGGRIVVLVHGLTMNDLQWTRKAHNHGEVLARELGFSPVYLHYNTGLHVADNGRQFSALLDQLLAGWPVPVEDLVIVGHSMGGLVTRSACHDGAGAAWRKHLSRMIFLGTPHHGAPLERGGRLLDQVLGFSPYVAPFARIGKVRSAGITDLRYGNVQEGDWKGRSRHDQNHDDRVPTPLPQDVPTYLVAATTGNDAQGVKSATLGDGLVPVASALGDTMHEGLALGVPASRRFILTGANHWDLLSRPEVGDQMVRWLRMPEAETAEAAGK